MTMSVQTQFNQFHNHILLENLRSTLVDSRERLIKGLHQKLSLSFTPYNQGSYAMGTGVRPINGNDYDIDLALHFNTTTKKYPDPVELKLRVKKALENMGYASDDIEVQDPCVTLHLRDHHVDLAIYASDHNQQPVFAWGKKRGSSQNSWEPADPHQMITLVNRRFTKGDRKNQFIRIIRYLKRWKDENFRSQGYSAPPGIALTTLVYEWFDPVLINRKPDDLEALHQFLERAKRYQYGVGNYDFSLPMKPKRDLFRKLKEGKTHLEDYQKKMRALTDDVRQTRHHLHQGRKDEALQLLHKQFGRDFPTL